LIKVTEEMIDKIKEDLVKIRAEREKVEEEGEKEVKRLEEQKKHIQMELEKKTIILNAAKKKNQVNALKIKEISRISKQGQYDGICVRRHQCTGAIRSRFLITLTE